MIKLLEIANSIGKEQQPLDEGFKEKVIAPLAIAAGLYGGYNKYIKQDTDKYRGKETGIEAPALSPIDTEDAFKKSVESIIDNIEGTYVNPKKHIKNPKERHIFRKSGETMFGIDRKTGGKINKTPAGRQFWDLIDKDKKQNPEKWTRFYDGGEIKDELKDLATQMMEPKFEHLFKTHLDPEAQQIVKSDPKLFFHFAYATWNGEGWFRKFANSFNKRIREGITDTNALFDSVIKDRKNGGGILERKADEVAEAAQSFY
jgi:hypothetical protein